MQKQVEDKLGMADVVILIQLVSLEEALIKANSNPYLEVNVKPLLDEVQSKIGPLSCKIREKMNKDEG